MGRVLILNDQGQIVLREAKANGAHGITLQAPASLAADLTWTLPATLPGSTQFLTIDNTGQLGLSVGSIASLDAAYDAGGSGAGRIVTADNGPVEIAGAGGLQVTHSAPAVLFETTGASVYNWKISANASSDMLFQRGGQDADVSDDTFATIACIEASTRRLGINTEAPQTSIHINHAGLSSDAKLRIQADAAKDATVQFYENAAARFELGYDDSAGGLVVGRLSFSNLALFVEDTTGDVGVNEGTPDAKLHVTSAENLVAIFESTEGVSGVGSIALLDKDTSDDTNVRISAVGNDMRLVAGAADLIHLDGADGRVGIGDTTPSAKLEIFNDVASQISAFINQDHASGRGLLINSAATSQPLIELEALDANTRGDITAAGTARVSDPSGPSDGDIWYNSTASRWKARLTGHTVTFANTLGPAFGPAAAATLVSGAVSATLEEVGVMVLTAQADTSPTDDLVSILVTGSAEVVEGDTLILRAASGETITVKHNTGNIHLDGSADKALTNGNQLMLIFDGTDWLQLTPMMTLP